MEPEDLLPRSQDPTTCLYPEPDRSSLCSHPTSGTFILILFCLQSGLLPTGFPTIFKALVSLICTSLIEIKMNNIFSVMLVAVCFGFVTVN
jgi:hypothetical protein